MYFVLVARSAVKVSVTLVVVIVAVFLTYSAWRLYAYTPWTRDGRVRALSVPVAPEVSGKVVSLNVRDNEFKKTGDVLFEIDPADYVIALQQAEANLQNARASMEMALSNLKRAEKQTDLSLAGQQREQTFTNAEIATASFKRAEADLAQATLDLERTTVRATVDGPITNMQLEVGRYVNKGATVFAQVNINSFYVYGYLEETKLQYVKKGDPVSIRLMGYKTPLRGHVRSIAPIIHDTDNTSEANGVANVEATFTWVRLAQRIPVHVIIDQVPPGVTLSSGMTTTIVVENQAAYQSLSPLMRRIVSVPWIREYLPYEDYSEAGPPPVGTVSAPDLYPLPLPEERRP